MRDIIDLPPRFEIGESSRAPFRVNPENDLIPILMSWADETEDRIGPLEHFVRDSDYTSPEHLSRDARGRKEGGF